MQSVHGAIMPSVCLSQYTRRPDVEYEDNIVDEYEEEDDSSAKDITRTAGTPIPLRGYPLHRRTVRQAMHVVSV